MREACPHQEWSGEGEGVRVAEDGGRYRRRGKIQEREGVELERSEIEESRVSVDLGGVDEERRRMGKEQRVEWRRD